MYIFVNDDYKILQDKRNPSLYTIKFDYYSEALIKSITKTKIILGATVTDHFTTVRFNATSIRPLKEDTPMTYELMLKMIYCLSSQLKYLIENCNNVFTGYSMDNVIIIDDDKFIYLPNNDYIHNIEDELITITYPFSPTDFFLSPEMSLISEIPSKVHYKSSYYSLASLIIFCLKLDDEITERNLINILDNSQIKGTKMYFLLIRCLIAEPENRCLLYI